METITILCSPCARGHCFGCGEDPDDPIGEGTVGIFWWKRKVLYVCGCAGAGHPCSAGAQ